MPTAGTGDPGRANLALLAHRPAQRAEVLVVNDVDLVAAELARLAPTAAPLALPVTPSRWSPATLLRHAKSSLTSSRTECRRPSPPRPRAPTGSHRCRPERRPEA